MADGYNLGQAGTMSAEEFAQQQQLNRQQQMAALLMQQGQKQTQGQMIGNRFVAPSFFQNILPLVQTAVGTYMGEKADTKAAKLAQAIRLNKADAEQDIINKMTPQESREAGILGPNGKMTTQTTADMYGADMQLNPVYQKVEAQQARGPDYAGALKAIRTNPYGAGKEMMSEVLKKQLGPDKPSDQLGYELAQSQGFPGTFLDWKVGLATAGAGRTYTNIQNQLPFKEQIQKGAAEKLIGNFETLQNVPAALANMDKMIALSKQPIYAGVGGETKLQIAKLFNNNFGTNISPETVKNTEEFKSAAYMGIMDNLKKTDSNPTMAQQNALKEAIGSLGTDPAAIPRVVGVMRDVLVNKATQHNELVRQTMQKGVEYPFSIEIPLPKTAPAPGNSVRSLADEILNRKPQ